MKKTSRVACIQMTSTQDVNQNLIAAENLIQQAMEQETFSDLFKIDLATATLNNFSEVMYDELEMFESNVLLKIKNAPVKHLDETGFRVAG